MAKRRLKHLEDAQAEIERLEAKAKELREKWTPVARKLLGFPISSRVQPELKLSRNVKQTVPHSMEEAMKADVEYLKSRMLKGK